MPNAQATTTDEQEIIQLYEKMWHCMVEKDIEGLATTCSDDFVLHHMTGMKQSKQEFLDAVADGTLNYFSAAHDLIKPTVTGDIATLTGRSRVSAAVFGGGRHTWRLQGKFAIRKEHGQWKLLEERTSTY